MDFALGAGKDVLRRTPRVLDALLSGLSCEWADADEGSGTWSPFQVVGHLAYIEEHDWIDRARVILEHGTQHAFEPVDREAGFARFTSWPLDAVLERFASLRSASLDALDSLVGDSDLNKRGVHPDFGEVTLAELLATWVVHDLNHLGQVVKTMAKQYRQAVGPWRALLPILDAP